MLSSCQQERQRLEQQKGPQRRHRQHAHAHLFENKELHSLYFGGGTPSLLTPAQIDKIISKIQKLNLSWHPEIEVTMEVNPATLNKHKLRSFIASGINRMSIGCQTFDDEALKDCNREHDSNDTVKTIELVSDHLENFSLDLLFSLPKQCQTIQYVHV